jgi:hypothetical protein
MAHDVSLDFIAAAEASVNDVSFDMLVSWLKNYDDTATFFELDVSTLDGPDFLKGPGDDVTFFDRYDYESEKDNVLSWDISRKTSLFPYGMFMAQSNVVLDNTSKKYLPGYDPVIGDYIKPRRPIRIYAGFDGENVQQFGGFSDIPKNTLGARTTTLNAVDVMDYFDTAETAIGYFEDEYWHDIVEALLLEQGFTADQFNLEQSTQPKIGFMPTSGMTLAEIFRKGCEAEQGTMFCDELGIIQLWNRFHYQYSGSPVKSMSYDNVIDVDYVDTPIINNVKVTALPRAVSALQKIWQSSSSTEVPANGSVIVSIQFKDDFGNLPVTAAHTPVFISDQDDDNKSYYNCNTESNGSGAVNDTEISVTDFSLVGDVAFVEFTNTDSIPMFITDLQIYGTPAKVTSEIVQEYRNQQSIDDYGMNPGNNGKVIEIKNDWIQNRGTAYAIAFTMVEEYKEGNQQLLVKPFADPSIMYGDPVEMTIDEVDDDPRSCIVVGTKLKSGLSKLLEQELTLDQRNLYNYFTLDSSDLDGGDVLAA